MLGPKNAIERVLSHQISNCATDDDAEWAILEIEATQGLNKRCHSGNRTYHLLLSFPTGEEPDTATLRLIEQRVVGALGFGEHQRVSAVHRDTDNIHVHVAINKIHPERRTIHTPFRDYQTLANVCRELEDELGLQRTNHVPRQTLVASRAQDMEICAGRESVQGFIRRECGEALRDASTWDSVHEILASHGLHARRRGSGLVFGNAETYVRASTVGREFSMGSLEARLGPFAPGPDTQPPPTRRTYRRGPLLGQESWRQAMFEQYEQEQAARLAAREAKAPMLRKRVDGEIAQAKRIASAQRAAIRLMDGGRLSKRILYSQVQRRLHRKIKAAYDRAREERRILYAHTRRGSWTDWLRQQTASGNADALRALRGRLGTADSGRTTGPRLPGKVEHVTLAGTIWRRLRDCVVREDRSHSMTVDRPEDDRAIRAAVSLAVMKHGTRLVIGGSDDFVERVARIAPTVDQRIQLIRDSDRSDDGAAFDRGRDRTRLRGAGRGVGGYIRPHPQPGSRQAATRAPARPPNRLHALSQGALVRVAKHGDLLLPRHVHSNVEHQGAAADPPVRRSAVAERSVIRRGGRGRTG
jgi:hypothetical protein